MEIAAQPHHAMMNLPQQQRHPQHNKSANMDLVVEAVPTLHLILVDIIPVVEGVGNGIVARLDKFIMVHLV